MDLSNLSIAVGVGVGKIFNVFYMLLKIDDDDGIVLWEM